MKIIYVLIAGGIATFLMTLFSYILSVALGKNYREPLLLNSIFRNSSSSTSVGKRNYWGYIVHFLIGYILSFLYFFLTESGYAELSPLSGIIFGLIAGVASLLVWKFLLKSNGASSSHPSIGYYTQLIFAHIIFGLDLSWLLNLAYIGQGLS